MRWRRPTRGLSLSYADLASETSNPALQALRHAITWINLREQNGGFDPEGEDMQVLKDDLTRGIARVDERATRKDIWTIKV